MEVSTLVAMQLCVAVHEATCSITPLILWHSCFSLLQRCMRVWDLIMSDGVLALHRCAVVLVQHLEAELLAAKAFPHYDNLCLDTLMQCVLLQEPQDVGRVIEHVWVDPEVVLRRSRLVVTTSLPKVLVGLMVKNDTITTQRIEEETKQVGML